jgi:hypothetical protein
LKEREIKAQELKLKLSQTGSLKSKEMYSSVDNQKAFERMLGEEKENRPSNVTQSQKFVNPLKKITRENSLKNLKLQNDE